MNEAHPVKLTDVSIRFFLDRKRDEMFYALKNLSMQLEEGEILGLVGRNGAGKSTLLKIIAGIYQPTSGQVQVKGRVAPLLELGSSFIPNLSGYDNIFFTGGLFGFSRSQIAAKASQIIEFSGMERFIHLPVKNYSTGMFARLSFSTMLFFDPDIVLIDEVFAVGDEDFQKKSMNRIFDFKKARKTIIIATHNLGLIESFCDRAIVLEKGEPFYAGSPHDATARYRALFEPPQENADKQRWGNGDIEITRVATLDRDGRDKRVFTRDDYIEIRLEFTKRIPGKFILGLAIKTQNGFLVTGPNRLMESDGNGTGSASLVIPRLPLNEGEFSLDATAYDTELVTAYDHIVDAHSFVVRKSTMSDLGFVALPGQWKVDA